MNERKPFQQLVDQSLSGLRWNEWRKQQVFAAMEERRPTYMKKKMTGLLAFALTLCLMAGVALAATLAYSNRYTQAEKADALLKETYGITESMRSFFTRTEENGVYTYTSLEDLSGMPGDYQVNVSTGEVKWLFDGPEGSGWGAEKLAEVLTRCQKQDGYNAVCAEAKADAEALGLTLPAPAPFNLEEAQAKAAQTQASAEQAQSMARLTMAEAEPLAREAIRQKYALTDDQMRQLEWVEESSYYRMNGDVPVASVYCWLTQQENAYTEKDGIYIVDVNALDGAIEGILYDNGLLGAG